VFVINNFYIIYILLCVPQGSEKSIINVATKTNLQTKDSFNVSDGPDEEAVEEPSRVRKSSAKLTRSQSQGEDSAFQLVNYDTVMMRIKCL